MVIMREGAIVVGFGREGRRERCKNSERNRRYEMRGR
jgi:hypothetical protein